MANLSVYGNAKLFQWTREYLIKVLTTGNNPIVTDPLIINALRQIDRKEFLPNKFKDQAYNDMELDLGYGEKLNKPTIIAQMLSLLKPRYGGKYLDLGSGTGYSGMLLAYIASDQGHIYSLERVQWLWEQARNNMKIYPKMKNIDILYKDAKEGLVNKAPFDGIHIGFAMENIPESLKMQLKVNNSRLVYPDHQGNLRVIERIDMDEFEEEIIPGFNFDKMKEGLA